MWLDAAINMNEMLDIILGDDSHADIDLGYEKNVYNMVFRLRQWQAVPIVPTLSEEPGISLIADENVVNHVVKSSLPPEWGRSHVRIHCVAGLTYTCT